MKHNDEELLVSVVIPTRDRPSQLRRAYAGVVRQTHRPIEVIVVDDGSARSVELEADEEVVTNVIRIESSIGRGNARNLGVAKSSGNLIAFLDDDDEWFDDHLSRLVQAFRSDPTCALIESGHEGVLAGRVLYQQVPTRNRPRSAIFKEPRVITSGVLVQRSAFESVGGFDASLDRHEDWDLWVRLAAKHHFECVPAVTVRRDIASSVAASDRLHFHQLMAPRIKRLLAVLPWRDRLRVRLWLARTTSVRRLHVLVAATAGEAVWRRVAGLKASLDQRTRRGKDGRRLKTW